MKRIKEDADLLRLARAWECSATPDPLAPTPEDSPPLACVRFRLGACAPLGAALLEASRALLLLVGAPLPVPVRLKVARRVTPP